MLKYFKIGFLILPMVLLTASNIYAIKKVAAQHNVLEFHIGNSQPQGSYEKIGVGGYGFDFAGDIDADDLYKNSMTFGFYYGQLGNNNILYTVGFSYSNVKHYQEFEDHVFVYTYPNEIKIRLYELGINCNYYFSSPAVETFSPYIGLGLQAGLVNAKIKGFDSESDFSYAVGLNFGADINVWKSADKMSSLALSSVNNYQFFAVDNRPKNLTIGAGLKYYFRP